MKITYNRQRDDLYIKLNGELDEHSAALARREADRLADSNADCVRVVFDLADVSFMDSTGIGFLIGRYKKFNRYGVKVCVANPSQGTDKILSMSGVYSLIRKL